MREKKREREKERESIYVRGRDTNKNNLQLIKKIQGDLTFVSNAAYFRTAAANFSSKATSFSLTFVN